MNTVANFLQRECRGFLVPVFSILLLVILLGGFLVVDCFADQPENPKAGSLDTGLQKAEELKELLAEISRPEVTREVRQKQLADFLARTGRLTSNATDPIPEDPRAKRLKVLIMKFSADRAGVDLPPDFQEQKMDAFETEADFELAWQDFHTARQGSADDPKAMSAPEADELSQLLEVPLQEVRLARSADKEARLAAASNFARTLREFLNQKKQ